MAKSTVAKAGTFNDSTIVGSEGGLGAEYAFATLNLAGKYPGMVPWFREAELKHGRMSMLAVVDMIVPVSVRGAGAQFPGGYFGWEACARSPRRDGVDAWVDGPDPALGLARGDRRGHPGRGPPPWRPSATPATSTSEPPL